MVKTVLSPAAAFASGTIPIEPMANANVMLAGKEKGFFAGELTGERMKES